MGNASQSLSGKLATMEAAFPRKEPPSLATEAPSMGKVVSIVKSLL
ncbi:hypothetical protein [Lyngbya aestuarii]